MIRQLKTINSKNININIKNIIPNEIEKFIINKINKNAPESYGQITDYELDNIGKQIFNIYKFNINKQIIASIKSGYMKNYIIRNHFNLKKNSNIILNEYLNEGVLNLSAKFNLSPMTIIRFVFSNIYNKKLKELLLSKKLTNYDQEQFKLAEQNDIYVTLDQLEQGDESIKFEKLIENYLIKNKIEYKTQEQLTHEQKIKFGKAINTPDFLITSELIINSKKVNWIDAKNFYGSNIEFVVSKIKKQIKKYLECYGSGCLIFNHGFNSELKFRDVLILDYDSMLSE
jgi:hypothetical protein